VEFQSTVYRYMAVQLMTYVGLLYEGLIRSRQFGPTGDLAPVVPIVLYNGSDRWTAAQDIATLVAEAPGELAVYRPRLRYVLDAPGCLPTPPYRTPPSYSAARRRSLDPKGPPDERRASVV
jgi:hypothetical protein